MPFNLNLKESVMFHSCRKSSIKHPDLFSFRGPGGHTGEGSYFKNYDQELKNGFYFPVISWFISKNENA